MDATSANPDLDCVSKTNMIKEEPDLVLYDLLVVLFSKCVPLASSETSPGPDRSTLNRDRTGQILNP